MQYCHANIDGGNQIWIRNQDLCNFPIAKSFIHDYICYEPFAVWIVVEGWGSRRQKYHSLASQFIFKPTTELSVHSLCSLSEDNLRIFAEALKPKLQPKLKTTCLEAFFIDYTPPPNLQLYVVLKQLISSLVLIELSVNKVVLLVTTFLSFQITQYL